MKIPSGENGARRKDLQSKKPLIVPQFRELFYALSYVCYKNYSITSVLVSML